MNESKCAMPSALAIGIIDERGTCTRPGTWSAVVDVLIKETRERPMEIENAEENALGAGRIRARLGGQRVGSCSAVELGRKLVKGAGHHTFRSSKFMDEGREILK